MFFREDTTYNDIRKKSLEQWLNEIESHEDIAVRGGVKLCREYMQYLNDKITKLEQENELKNQYLKKMAAKNKQCYSYKKFSRFKTTGVTFPSQNGIGSPVT